MTVRLAAIQAAPKLFDREESLTRFEYWLQQAADDNVDLAVFPEAFLGGYPKGVDFGARVGSRDMPGRELFQRYFETSFAVDGPEFAQAKAAIGEAGSNVVVGMIEPVGSTLYCSAATIDRRGELIGLHRKLIPTAMERLLWGNGGPDTMQVARADVGVVSSAICWENYMTAYRQHLYEQGAEFYCAPTVDDRVVWTPSMQMIALEGRCFVISACQYMTRADVADDADYNAIQGDAPETVLINGGSSIISPLGEIVAGPIAGKSTMVTADIDKGEITRGKFDMDVAGHYARPDIFDLQVRKK